MNQITSGDIVDKWLKIKESCELVYSLNDNSCAKTCDPEKCPKIKENW